MNNLHEVIQSWLSEWPKEFCEKKHLELQELIEASLGKVEKFVGKCGQRLVIRGNQVLKKQASWKDFAVALRQYILFSSKLLILPNPVASEIRLVAEEFGMIVSFHGECSVMAATPQWLEQKKYIEGFYDLHEVRQTKPAVGDALLERFSGFKYYKSFEQKIAIHTVIRLNSGSTLLVSLPTGAGKSMVGLMMACCSQKPGLTIVVVPTVALAIDQMRAAKELQKVNNNGIIPSAYYGEMSKEDRQQLYSDLENKSINILYTSPEALINGKFFDLLLELAPTGYIKNFIIDEAHLVTDWGESFRTEFQLLSIYRKRLLEKTNGELKTLLLSATYTDKTVGLLRKLFSEQENCYEVRGDSLRKEPIYCLDISAKTEEVRQQHVLKCIHILPRPMILYVNRPDEAESWRQAIEDCGFKNFATFTGKTGHQAREAIIEKWNSNSLDFIVATSAFGMGVDKDDVRTVLHACIPDNLNRLYQEVGRGGRDGLPSLSMLSVVRKVDEPRGFNFVKGKVLTAEKILGRWKGLFKTAESEGLGDVFWLDMNAKPIYTDEDEYTGLKNANWNEYVVLFLFRHNFLDLLDVLYDTETRTHHIRVRLQQIDLINNDSLLEEKIVDLRETEFNQIKSEWDQVKHIFRNPKDLCWSIRFQETYRYADENCGGCPSCHAIGQTPTYLESSIKEISGFETVSQKSYGTTILGRMQTLKISYPEDLDFKSYCDGTRGLRKFIEDRVNEGIELFIVPQEIVNNWDNCSKLFTLVSNRLSLVLTINDMKILDEHSHNLLIQPNIVVIYGGDSRENAQIFAWSQEHLRRSEHNRIIFLCRNNLRLANEAKLLQDMIDGFTFNLSEVVKEAR